MKLEIKAFPWNRRRNKHAIGRGIFLSFRGRRKQAKQQMVPCECLMIMKVSHKLLFALCPMLVLVFIYYSSGKLSHHIWGYKQRE
ncbi:hypothetical protein AMELA_G00212730 [Ameiurus melas]|uniref:Uncharacterized protein n=1 Tax=Ameiurus melas TaxID=219545 RepID=A0A7J6A0S4_AMEME|nr:hypothetical protein AMELA_G00212730 [Ameiurus melas]